MTHHIIAYELKFKTPFRLAHGTRTGTQALFLVLSQNGKTGYGEATFPPYLPQTAEQCRLELEKVLPQAAAALQHSPTQMHLVINGFGLSPFARNLLVNALTDLYLKLHELDVFTGLGLPAKTKRPLSTFTLTKNDDLKGEKLSTARHFSMLKLKLDGVNDIGFVETVKNVFDRPFCVDVNQGWEKLEMDETVLLTEQLKALDCVLVEQPFDKNNHERHAALKQMKILPVFADEGVQDVAAFRQHGHCYDGINVKLLKCGGIDHAVILAGLAQDAGKKVIVGCMSESSCGCATAYALEPLADYLDLDGPWLVANDPFKGLKVENGKMSTAENGGFGFEINDLFTIKGH